MKRFSVLFLAILMVVFMMAFCGCKADEKTSENSSATTKQTQTQSTETENTESDEKAPVNTETKTEKDNADADTTTQKKTENDRHSQLYGGVWIRYSPQAAVFDAYEFSDSGVKKVGYSYMGDTITEIDTSDSEVYMTYKLDSDEIIITENSDITMVWKFTENDDILTYTYQDYYGPEPAEFVTQNIFRHENIPSLEEILVEKEKGYE